MRMIQTPRTALCLVLAALLLAGCGKSPAAPGAAAAAREPAAAAATPAQPVGVGASGADAGGLTGRSGTLNNPDNATMVFLYYDLAGITPPVDQWVEDDHRVRYAPGVDKAAHRAAVRAEFEAGLAAVRGVGVLQLTLQAGLSSYDPTYGEFTVGALSPGAVYTFKAQGQTINLKFDNALTAQSWSVPKDQAQAIVDRVGNDSLLLDATLHIRKVLPGPGGGTVVAHVDSWNLRDSRSGSTVARVTAIKD
ncbi:MAG: hypothetical protein ACTHJ9_16580 [Rhodanobacter sp.]